MPGIWVVVHVYNDLTNAGSLADRFKPSEGLEQCRGPKRVWKCCGAAAAALWGGAERDGCWQWSLRAGRSHLTILERCGGLPGA
eukprot:2543355-Lingulodinium_polyedra.AAC.1